MTREQTYASLDAMLTNPKAKTFLNHLVRAYIPDNKVIKPNEKPSGDYKCVLTKTPLICEKDLNTIINSEQYQIELKNSTSDNIESKSSESLAKILGNKKQSVTGKDTTTFMSVDAYQFFVDWVNSKSVNNDKHITWLLGAEKHSEFIKKREKSEDDSTKNKSGRTTFSLGDTNDVLLKLKTQMENNEKLKNK